MNKNRNLLSLLMAGILILSVSSVGISQSEITNEKNWFGKLVPHVVDSLYPSATVVLAGTLRTNDPNHPNYTGNLNLGLAYKNKNLLITTSYGCTAKSFSTFVSYKFHPLLKPYVLNDKSLIEESGYAAFGLAIPLGPQNIFLEAGTTYNKEMGDTKLFLIGMFVNFSDLSLRQYTKLKPKKGIQSQRNLMVIGAATLIS